MIEGLAEEALRTRMFPATSRSCPCACEEAYGIAEGAIAATFQVPSSEAIGMK